MEKIEEILSARRDVIGIFGLLLRRRDGFGADDISNSDDCT